MPSHVPPEVGDDVKVDFGDAGCVLGRVVAKETLPAEAGFSYDIFLAVSISDNQNTIIKAIKGKYIGGIPPYINHT